MKTVIIMFFLFFLALLISNTSCAERPGESVNTSRKITTIKCYSGGELIYQAQITGKFWTDYHTNVWYIEDSVTSKSVRIAADCIAETIKENIDGSL